jgi:hypothetical protein
LTQDVVGDHRRRLPDFFAVHDGHARRHVAQSLFRARRRDDDLLGDPPGFEPDIEIGFRYGSQVYCLDFQREPGRCNPHLVDRGHEAVDTEPAGRTDGRPAEVALLLRDHDLSAGNRQCLLIEHHAFDAAVARLCRWGGAE